MDFQEKGKIALVTGASSGIGRAVAIALAKAGIVTVGAARSLDKLQQLQEEMKSQNIQNFVPVQMDVTDKNDVSKPEKFCQNNKSSQKAHKVPTDLP